MADFYVRLLEESEIEAVVRLDNVTDNYVEECIKDNIDYAWGAFLKTDGLEKLIGYCTTGYAEGCKEIMKHPLYTVDSILLSDVFILPEYRGKKYGSRMVEEAIRIRRISDGVSEPVYLKVLDDNLKKFYTPLGFKSIDDSGNMILTADCGNEKIIAGVDAAMRRFSADDLSVDINELTDMIDINICTRHSSSPYMTSVAGTESCDLDELIKELDSRDIGHCGF